MKKNENHELIELELMDTYYGEKELSPEMKEHISMCSKCAAFWESLSVVDNKFSVPDTKIEVDERIIRNAFSEAGRIVSRKRELRDFAGFALTATTLLGAVVWLAFIGYGIQIILVQLLLIIVAPISVPALIWRRLAKEASK